MMFSILIFGQEPSNIYSNNNNNTDIIIIIIITLKAIQKGLV